MRLIASSCSPRVLQPPRHVQPPRRHLFGPSASLPNSRLKLTLRYTQIPKNLRMMYVHAWQSYIWNRVLSERVKLFGAKQPVEGDLVYADEGGDDDVVVAEDEETVVAEDAADEPAAADESAGAASTPANPQLAHWIATSKVRKVRALTAADIASGKYSIYDVVLPMPGFAVVYPAGELGEVYKRVIREDGIDPDDMWRKQKEYSLVRPPLSFSSSGGVLIGLVHRAEPTARSSTSRKTSRTACSSRPRQTKISHRAMRTVSSASLRRKRGSTRRATDRSRKARAWRCRSS